MASRSPSPNSSPSAVPPASPTNSTPASGSNTDTPPSSSPTPSNFSVPPPQSSPPPVASTPPPTLPQSPLPVTSPPPPALPSSPPPLSPPSPPPLPPSSPPVSPPPSPSTAPPPTTNSPPPSPPVSPPPSPSTAPPTTNSPPPLSSGSPPKESPAPPVAPPPPPPAVSPSSPPPAVSSSPPPPAVSSSPPPPAVSSSPPPSRDPSPPTTSPPPPSVVHPPKSSHAPPPLSPPPTRSPSSPPSTSIPPPASLEFPPPVPSSSMPPSVSPPSPQRNSSVNGSTPVSPLPSISTENPTSRSTQSSPNITADSTSGNFDGLKAGGVAVIGSVVGILAVTLVVLAVWFTNRRRKRKDRFSFNYAMPSPFASSQNSGPQSSAKLAGSASANNFIYSTDGGIGTSRSWFTYEELSEATNGFSKDNILGEGGFGCVYKGVLVDGREVAVKQLKAGSEQGEREFRAEVEIISRIHHRHLVSLVGYCISEHQRLLIYDYVPNDTLHYHLHGEGKPVMNWATRIKVAAGSARGLAYLHEDCQSRIIHRDIKSSNILLDKNFEARVADFGLAKLALDLDLHTHVSTRVMGTFGYLAPEYASTGKLTVKSDVFSFGVVLLELITGRKPVDASQPLGDESLVEWARPLLAQALETEDFGDLVDPRLENNFVESEMFHMIESAAACVRHLAAKRPRMSQLVRALDAMDELEDLNNGTKPGQSGIFDSREHSAHIRMFQRMAFGSQEHSSEFFKHSQSSWRD